jgi:cell division protein FtsQ
MPLIGTHTQERRNRPLEEVLVENKKRKISAPASLPIKGGVLYLLIAAGVLGLLALANGYQESIVCEDISISIQSPEDQAFLSTQDIKQIIGLDYERPILGEKMNSIELLHLEEALQANPYIQKAEVYKSLKGILYVEVEQRRPIARVVNPNGSSLYVDDSGHKFPVTRRHVANLPLVRGAFAEAFKPADSLSCELLDALPVLTFIDQHPFWKAQVSEIRVKKNGDLILYPEVGKMYMEFGPAVRIEDKFNRLYLFFQKVANELGWEKYRGVSVKYRGQVVAKKR